MSSTQAARTLARLNERGRREFLAARCATDIELFAHTAAPEAFRLPFAEYHRTLFAWHAAMQPGNLDSRTGMRFALAAPRGHAKSTVVSFLLLLHDIAYRREKYVILVSATERQAGQRLRALAGGLERLRQSNSPFPATIAECNASVLVANGVRVEAFGAGCEMRGIAFDSWRPTKIVLDDAEASAAAGSARARRRLHDWFGEVVEHLGDRATHLLAIGTVLHGDGLLARLLARPDFTSLRLRAMESFPEDSPLWREWRGMLAPGTDGAPCPRTFARAFFTRHRAAMERGSRVLWPAKEDCEELMAQLALGGRRAFWQEKQNEPLGPEDALFAPDAAWRARVEGASVVILAPGAGAARVEIRRYPVESLRRFGFLDAAMGKGRARGEGDFAALATVALAPDGLLILESLWLRRAPPTEQVRAVLAAHRAVPFERFAIEGTAFQELLLVPLAAESKRLGMRDLPLEAIAPRMKKEQRIAGLEPLLASCRLALAESLAEEFWGELASYPRCEHDDALDAAAGAAAMAAEARSVRNIATPSARSRPKRLW